MDTTLDRAMAEIRAMVSASGVSESRIARLVASAAKAALKGAPGGGNGKRLSTHEQAKNTAPGVYRVKGAVGLHLKKTTVGSGAWSYRFRLGGRRREMGLGALADVTLAQAVDKALALRLEVKKGINPIVARRAAKADAARADAYAANAAGKWTFKQATENYLKAHQGSWKHPASRRLFLNQIVKYAYPVIGSMDLDLIRVEHIVAIVDATQAQGAPSAGSRVRLRIEQVINAAIALGKRNAALGNPAATKLVKAVRPQPKASDDHFRRLELADAPAVFRELMARAESSTAFAAWIWTIATASRPGEEALKARWDEIDANKATWTVPVARMKGGKAHVVPLSSIARAVLGMQAGRRAGDGAAVFPGASGSPLSYAAFSRAPAKAGIDAGSPHSWRSIWRDWAEDIGGVAPQTAEAALAHSLGKVQRAYRRETGVPARAVAMQRYAEWLQGDASNVVAFSAMA
jgi:integrase